MATIFPINLDELSQILAGIKTAATSATLGKASFVGMPVVRKMTRPNKFDISDITGLVAKSGLNGKITESR